MFLQVGHGSRGASIPGNAVVLAGAGPVCGSTEAPTQTHLHCSPRLPPCPSAPPNSWLAHGHLVSLGTYTLSCVFVLQNMDEMSA